jgi:hypothetical protein
MRDSLPRGAEVASTTSLEGVGKASAAGNEQFDELGVGGCLQSIVIEFFGKNVHAQMEYVVLDICQRSHSGRGDILGRDEGCVVEFEVLGLQVDSSAGRIKIVVGGVHDVNDTVDENGMEMRCEGHASRRVWMQYLFV